MDAFIHVACIPQPAAIGAKKKTRSRGNASSSTRRCLTTLVCETGILQRQFLTGIARLKALGKDLQKEAGKNQPRLHAVHGEGTSFVPFACCQQ